MLTRLIRSQKHRHQAATPADPQDQTQADTQADTRADRLAVTGRGLRRALAATAVVAVAGTGVGTVVTGQAGFADDSVGTASASRALEQVTSDDQLAERLTERSDSSSRSDRREATDPAKAAALAPSDAQAVVRSEQIQPQDPKDIAQSLLGEYGFSSGEFSCLEQLWEKESGWDPTAANPTSSAYGIPQALPGSKMASAGPNWETDPATQIRWGLGYIQDRYGSPCSAWSHSQANNWY